MDSKKYIGMDVHTATISAAVRDSNGNLVMEATLPHRATIYCRRYRESKVESAKGTLPVTRLTRRQANRKEV
jgi:ribosomal protein L32